MVARLRAYDFRRIVDNTKRFTSSDAKLMQYIYLQFDKEKKEVKATATNGYSVSIEYARLYDIDESFNCLIKPNIPKILKGDIEAEITLADNKAYVRVNESITGYAQPEGTYYDFSKSINDIEKGKIVKTVMIDPLLLKDALLSATYRGYRPKVYMDIREDTKSPVVIRSGGKNDLPENIKIVLPLSSIRE